VARTDDLEDFWSDLKTKPGLLIETPKNDPIEGTLDLACLKTLHDIEQKCRPVMDPKTWGGLLNALHDIIRRLKAHIEQDLRARGPSALIEFVLMDTSLSVTELHDFVRALPESLVKRICEEGSESSATRGVHALLAFEWHYRRSRTRFLGDYILTRGGDGVLEARIRPSGGDPIKFRLDESFRMEDSGVGSK